MSSLPTVKNIIFDLGGVLLNIDYQLTSKAFQDLGWSNFDEFYSQKKQNKIFDQLEIGNLSPEKFVLAIQEYLPESSKEEILFAWNAMLLDLPVKRIELLKKLKKTHQLFLFSNTNKIHYLAFAKMIKESHGGISLDSLFTKAYYSHQLGKRKPDVESFNHLLDQHELNASETLFIDDSLQHILGAQKAGLHTYHLQKNEEVTSLFPDTIR